VNQVIEEKQSFLEQMRDFLRANAMLFLVAGIALLLISDVFGTHGVLAMRRSEQQANDIQRQIDQLNAENQKLEARVKSLKTDPAAVEQIARVEMGLARKGEFIFKVPSRNAASTDSSQAAGGSSGNSSGKP
jgi:cell division protein FtsB